MEFKYLEEVRSEKSMKQSSDQKYDINSKLSTVKQVCTTADIWGGKKGFLRRNRLLDRYVATEMFSSNSLSSI